MRFQEKVNQFIKDATPVWHITYNEVNYRILGIHPKDPRNSPIQNPLLSVKVKLIDDDQLSMVEEILTRGIFNYEVDKDTLKIKLRDRSKPANDYGDFVRIEFTPDLDTTNLDTSLSILLEQKVFRIKLLTDLAVNRVASLLTTAEEDPKLRFYITEYNNPNKLLHPIVFPVRALAEQKEIDIHFDGADLPPDISIYYIKIFNNIRFEVR
jgi:hypothetical protein